MGSVFHDLYDMLKRNEKEMLISRSGSTTDSRCEKIRSGQSYLYKRCGMESEVLEIRFRSRVFGAQLNQALLIAIKRYPYFNTRLVEKDGDFYRPPVFSMNSLRFFPSWKRRKIRGFPFLYGSTFFREILAFLRKMHYNVTI